MSEEDRELIRDFSKRRCDSCNASRTDLPCSASLSELGAGLPNHAWNCWHPKGTILVVYEKPL